MKIFLLILGVSLWIDYVGCKEERLTGEIDAEKSLKNINDYRRKFAKKWKISNMIKLEWDSGIVEKIRNDEMSPGKSAIAGANSKRKVKDDANKFKDSSTDFERVAKEIGNTLPEFMNNTVLFAGFKHVGCLDIWFPAMGKYLDEWEITCYFLPDFTLEQMKAYKKDGEPGSQCEKEFKNEDGLCVYEKPKTTVKPKTPENQKTPEDPKNPESSTNGNMRLSFHPFLVFFAALLYSMN